MSDRMVDKTMSGLSDSEAREFHRIFMTSFIIFVVVAIIAHFLAWQWRPWLPSAAGYSMLDTAKDAVFHVKSYLA